MDSYKVVVTTDAITDLVELRNYIADVLLSPDIALKYVRMIRKEITSLQTLPARAALVKTEPWHSRGLRYLIVKNFYVYYRIDEPARIVYVLNVIYNRRDQLHALSEMR